MTRSTSAHIRRSAVLPAALVCVALLAAACSTTHKSAAGGRKVGANAGDAPLGALAGDTSSTVASNPSSGQSSSAAGARGATVAAPRKSGQPPVPSAPGVSGVTGGELVIGSHIAKGLDTLAASLGAKGGGTTGEAKLVPAIAAYINATGGIGGRKLRVVYHETDTTQGTFASQAQAACDAFVNDAHVFAVDDGTLSNLSSGNELATCLAKHNVPMLEAGTASYDKVNMAGLGGFLYLPSRMVADRWPVSYVDGLKAQGYFDPGAKIGLLRMDNAVFERIAGRISQRLGTYGLSITESVALSDVGSVGDLGGMSAELNSAILRFRRAGVDHVLFTGGPAAFFMLQQSESQGYRPRWGVTSLDSPAALEANAPAAELAKVVAVGWSPAEDWAAGDDPVGNAASSLCFKILKDAQVDSPGTRLSLSHCDNFMFLRAALDRAKEVSPAGLANAVAGLGTSYLSPYTWTTKFGPGRIDGADATRNLLFDSGCGCFKYVGPFRPSS